MAMNISSCVKMNVYAWWNFRFSEKQKFNEISFSEKQTVQYSWYGFELWLCHYGIWHDMEIQLGNDRGEKIIMVNSLNTLRLRQNGHHFPADILKWIFLNENLWTSIKISLKFILRGPINNNPSLVQIMAWCWSGDKPLSEPMMVGLLMHICVTQPQWVKISHNLASLVSHGVFITDISEKIALF